MGSYRNHRLSILVEDLKTIQKDVSDINETLNEKISNLNTAFQVFKANIEKDLEGLDHVVGHPQNLVVLGKRAEEYGITKPLRNQPVPKSLRGGRCYDRGHLESIKNNLGGGSK